MLSQYGVMRQKTYTRRKDAVANVLKENAANPNLLAFSSDKSCKVTIRHDIIK